ncbi:MAG: SDR family NAD(P)-dependent oxidoreductase, partial [Mycobacterium sp.]
MDLGVRGKGYVVVGGTAGMGLAAARALAREGASVVVVGRDADRGK